MPSPRYDEVTDSNIPEQSAGDMRAFRHGGDGIAVPLTGARIQGYYPAGTAYRDVQVDANGVLQTSGGGGGGGAVTIADGANVVEGATTDAAVITDTTGTMNGKLRGLVKWAFERMPASLGQKAMAASLPVVIASDQSALTVATHAITDANLDNATLVDNAAFTDGTTRLMMAGYILDDTAGTALTENDAAAPRISTNRATVGVIEDGATRARYATVTAANALKVDASGVAVPVTDNAGSLTVDAPVGTPVNVRLSDGAANYDGTKTGQLPSALVGGRLDENVGAWLGSTAPTVGSKTSANSVPVVIASDQVVIPVSDNAGSLTVDAPVGTPANVQVGDGTRQATVRAAGSNNALNVALVDASGNQITTFGGSATDGQTTETTTTLISGWDGFNIRAANVRNVNGINSLYTHDPMLRRKLDELLLAIGSDSIDSVRNLNQLEDRVTAYLSADTAMVGSQETVAKRAFANVPQSTTDQILVPAAAGKRLRVMVFRIHAGATATNVTFNSHASSIAGGAISETFATAANGGHHGAFCPFGHFETAPGQDLTVTTGAGSTVGIGIVYLEV